MIKEENLNLNNKSRRRTMIDFVRRNPDCDKEQVIIYCTEKGKGSRVTIRKTMNELENEGILIVHREKKILNLIN